MIVQTSLTVISPPKTFFADFCRPPLITEFGVHCVLNGLPTCLACSLSRSPFTSSVALKHMAWAFSAGPICGPSSSAHREVGLLGRARTFVFSARTNLPNIPFFMFLSFSCGSFLFHFFIVLFFDFPSCGAVRCCVVWCGAVWNIEGGGETVRVCLAGAAGWTEFRFGSHFPLMTFPKVSDQPQIQ